MTHFASVDVVSLSLVTGGQQAQQPSQPQAPAPQPQQPRGGNDTQWISNAAKCARVGGPVLGAICGALTPTPAY